MGLNLGDIVTHFLKKNAEQKFTARQIAHWVAETYPAECEQKLKNSKNRVLADISSSQKQETFLIGILVAEIGARRPFFQKKMPQIKMTEGRPRKYYYTARSDEAEVEAVESKEEKTQSPLLERSLYPVLIEYLKSEHNLYVKRIDERRAINNRGYNGNEWLYPDIVALEDLTAGWLSAVSSCVSQYGDGKAKLWSFEVKRLINLSNVRNAFFQTVSNSSWANFTYLVAMELAERAEKELRMLAGLHGIGFILLDMENCSESQIMIPARERPNLDWDSINRLAEASKDFTDYINEIKDFCQTGKTKAQDWN